MALGKFKLNFLNPQATAKPSSTRFGVIDEEEVPTFNAKNYRGLKFGGETADEPISNLTRLLQPEEVDDQPEELTSVSPEFEATKAYINHMRNMPKREDYKPGVMDKLLATAAGALSGKGASAMAIARDTVNRPYNTSLQDWSNEGAGLEDAAKAESSMGTFGLKQQDAVMRALGLQDLSNYRQGTLQNNERKQAFEEEKFEKEQKSRADALVANGWKVSTIDGRVTAHNPLTQEKRDLGEDKSVSISAYNAQTGRRNSDINARNSDTTARNVDSLIENREETTDINRANVGSLIISRGKTKAGQNKAIPPREQAIAEMLAAQDVVAENPKFKKYIDAEGNLVVPQDGMFSSADLSDYNDFRTKLVEKANQRLRRRYDFTDSDSDDIEDLDLNELPEG